MSKLSERREQAEAKFNDMVKQREQVQGQLTEIDAELNRLQGEWRLLQEMEAEATKEALSAPEEVKDFKPSTDPAVIEATKVGKK